MYQFKYVKYIILYSNMLNILYQFKYVKYNFSIKLASALKLQINLCLQSIYILCIYYIIDFNAVQ